MWDGNDINYEIVLFFLMLIVFLLSTELLLFFLLLDAFCLTTNWTFGLISFISFLSGS